MTQLPANHSCSPFDAIRHEDEEGEYWLARELAKALGYDRWENFLACIEEAIEVYRSQSGDPAQVLRASAQNPSAKGGRPRLDYRLSRHACYLIAQGADGRKDEVAAAKTYFAVMTREQEELQGLINELGVNPLTEVAQRILRRQELTEAHKRLMKRARDAGVITPEQCARFVNWGYKGCILARRRMIFTNAKGFRRVKRSVIGWARLRRWQTC